MVEQGWDAIPNGGSRWIAARLGRSPSQHPGCVAVVGPIYNWALMMQPAECSMDDMQVAWRTQYFQIASAPAPTNWKLVKGPAGAIPRSVLHLGWKCSSCYSVQTRIGEVLDLRATAPCV
eukprot:45560-Pyramimonas_sp.AAC.1